MVRSCEEGVDGPLQEAVSAWGGGAMLIHHAVKQRPCMYVTV